MKKQIPEFRSKEEAALFWENHEVLDYIDPDEFKVVKPGEGRRHAFINPQRKPVKQLISLRIDSSLLKKAKASASKKRVGYQTILRLWLERGTPSS